MVLLEILSPHICLKAVKSFSCAPAKIKLSGKGILLGRLNAKVWSLSP